MLVAQIVTGVVLAMHYVPSATMAFASVEHIMRDVNYGWLMRYLHSNGASMFFLAVYVHMFRGIYYGSYKAPREVLWILGVIIYLLMMATAFMGYVLPWGSMSFAGATVITNLFTAIPVVGTSVAHWLWGGYAVGDPTLNRFFSLHYLLPFMIVGVVVLHVWALHVVGQNNPDGVEVKDVERDTVAFTPYATIKDVFGAVGVPDRLRLVRLLHPELSARRRQFGAGQSAGDARRTSCRNGICCRSTRSCARSPTSWSASSRCSAAIALLAFLPWLDTSPVKSGKYRPVFRVFFWLFVVCCVGLGWLGSQEVTDTSDLGRAHPGGRLFRLLPRRAAAARADREDQADAGFDRRRGARQNQTGRGGRAAGLALIGRHFGGFAKMIRLTTTFLAAALVAAGVTVAFAQDEGEQPKPAAAELELLRPVRHIRSGAVAARLPGLPGSLQQLPQAQHSLPRARGPVWSRLQRRRRSRRWRRATRSSTTSRTTRAKIFKRPGTPADIFPPPDSFPNDQAAAAALGKAPPDMAVLAKARKYERGFPWFIFDALPFDQYQEMGADYIYAILTGYTKPDDPTVEPLLSRPQDRDAAADRRRRGRIYGRHARRSSTITRATSPRS